MNHFDIVRQIQEDLPQERVDNQQHQEEKKEALTAIIADYMTGYALIAQRLRANARPGQTSFDLIQEMVREALTWRVENADLRPLVGTDR